VSHTDLRFRRDLGAVSQAGPHLPESVGLSRWERNGDRCRDRLESADLELPRLVEAQLGLVERELEATRCGRAVSDLELPGHRRATRRRLKALGHVELRTVQQLLQNDRRPGTHGALDAAPVRVREAGNKGRYRRLSGRRERQVE